MAERIYRIDGKQVPASTYQAYLLVKSSVDAIKQNKTEAAIKILRQALAYDPQVPEAHAMLGVALARTGQTQEATEELQSAIYEKNDLLNAYIDLAALYQSNGNLAAAVDIYDKVCKQFPDSKVLPAVRERASLLSREIENEKAASDNTDQDAYIDSQSYYSNVVSEGKRQWPQEAMPLRVYVYPADGVSEFRPEYNAVLRQCFDEWQTASHGKVRFRYVNDIDEADITFRWIDDPSLLESSAEGGEAQVHSLLGAITGAQILVSVQDADSIFPLGKNLVRTLCLHEIGHALGLVGHSAKSSDVLYCTSPIVDREQHLSKRDVNTLLILYRDDVDLPSKLAFQLDRITHGHAVPAFRLLIILSTGVLTLVIIVAGISSARKKKGRAKKRR